mgnify:CR=1 FL=1
MSQYPYIIGNLNQMRAYEQLLNADRRYTSSDLSTLGGAINYDLLKQYADTIFGKTKPKLEWFMEVGEGL